MSDLTTTGHEDAWSGLDPLPWLLATLETGEFAVALRRGDGQHIRYTDPERISGIYAAGETPGVLLYRPHHLLADPEAISQDRSTLTVGGVSYGITSAKPICDLVTCEAVELADADIDPLDIAHAAIEASGGEPPGVSLAHGYRFWSHIGWFSHIAWFGVMGTIPTDPDFDPPPGFPKEPQADAPDTTAIGLIDNGVDKRHSWMVGKVTGDGSTGTAEHDAHGTMVAGILRQGAPGSTINSKAIRVSNSTVEETKVIEALCELRDAGVKWVVMAFGGEDLGSCLERAIDAYMAAPTNGHVVAAAGNLDRRDGADRAPVAPARYPNVLAVACGPVGQPGDVTDYRPGLGPVETSPDYYDWSNGGTWVDFIVNLDLRKEYLYTSYLTKGSVDQFAQAQGTSLAAPLVAAHLVSGRPYADQAGLV